MGDIECWDWPIGVQRQGVALICIASGQQAQDDAAICVSRAPQPNLLAQQQCSAPHVIL